MTGAPNVASGPPMNPYGVDVLNQGRYTGDTGTAPIVATGGEEGLKARLAIATALREAQGGSPLEIALKQAQIQHLQDTGGSAVINATTNKQQTFALRQQQLDQQNQQRQQTQQQKAQQDWEKNNTDTYPKLRNEIDKNLGTGTYDSFVGGLLQSGGDISANRGRVENGKWIPDPNGPMVAAEPPAPNTGIFGTGIGGGPGDASTTKIIPYKQFQPYINRYQNIDPNTGKYTPPMPSTTTPSGPPSGGGTTKTPSGGGIPSITTPDQGAQYPNSPYVYIPGSNAPKNNPYYKP
jgi:hypothetical protein